MPVVVHVRGFHVRVYPEDHEPAHVHVWKAGNEAIVLIDDEVRLREIRGKTTNRDVRRAVEIVGEHIEVCRQAWRETR